ncbi:hypothetical protein GDO86_001626 [Hymenochirus boettgeri]|uniref:Ig-like domain-containing protein n=1 Tax=Hymenochirus boettgeri TaxID=247094 RepID=A0A8T2KDI5_9PIPI|nr:hypothetical protein GDO86_001626 [Hymenochirus boettgeri]
MDSQLYSEKVKDIALSCSYITSYSTAYYLYWYRQYPSSSPKYILHKANKGHYSNTEPFALNKFESELSSNSTTLRIMDINLEDSALYICALSEDTV